MIKEVNDHESYNHWDDVSCRGKPPDVKTILAIWAFKRKFFPGGQINKRKAHLCAYGGMQQCGITIERLTLRQ